MSDLDEKLTAIRAGLKGVTPGPWQMAKVFFRNGFGSEKIEVQSDHEKVPVLPWSAFDDSHRTIKRHRANAAHIARLDPDTVRAILDRLDELTRERDRLCAENERMREALEAIASGRYSGVVLTSLPPKDPAVERARAALNGEGHND